MSWETVRFGDLYAVESRNGLTKPGKVRGSGYKMINMGELFANDRIYDIPMEFVPLKESEKLNARVECGDLLFARQSLVLEGAGKCSIVMEVSPLTVFESHLIRVRLDRSQALPMFYYYYFRSSLSPVKSIVSQCAQAGFRGSDLQELQVILPPIKVQQRIAEIISRYDDLIENNQKQIKLLEEAAQRLYKEWFVDLRFPGHEATPIVDGVPEGWKKDFLGGICTLKKDTVPAEQISTGTPYMGLEHMPRVDFCLSSWGNADNVISSKFRYIEDDIIFGKIRPYFHKAGFALNNGVVSTDSFVMKAKDGVWGLLLMTVFDRVFVDYTYQTCKEGSKMPRADWNQMEKYPILIPSEKTRRDFEKLIWNITRQVKTLALQNHALVEARDRLLPKLMSGEIEV